MDNNKSYAGLLLEMEALIKERDALIVRDKNFLKRSFVNEEFSFKDLQGEAVAVFFQIMLCSDLILERAGRAQMPVPFMQHLVEELPNYYVAWAAQEAAKQAAEHMNRVEAPGPPPELTQSPSDAKDEWQEIFEDPDLPIN